MSKKKSVNRPRSQYEVYRSIRKDWGEIKPYTRIEEDKRHKKPKYKKDYSEE